MLAQELLRCLPENRLKPNPISAETHVIGTAGSDWLMGGGKVPRPQFEPIFNDNGRQKVGLCCCVVLSLFVFRSQGCVVMFALSSCPVVFRVLCVLILLSFDLSIVLRCYCFVWFCVALSCYLLCRSQCCVVL